jgi:hypothetical protein
VASRAVAVARRAVAVARRGAAVAYCEYFIKSPAAEAQPCGSKAEKNIPPSGAENALAWCSAPCPPRAAKLETKIFLTLYSTLPPSLTLFNIVASLSQRLLTQRYSGLRVVCWVWGIIVLVGVTFTFLVVGLI